MPAGTHWDPKPHGHARGMLGRRLRNAAAPPATTLTPQQSRTLWELYMKDPICNSSTWQAEAGGSLQVQNQPGLHGETLYSKPNQTKPLWEKKLWKQTRQRENLACSLLPQHRRGVTPHLLNRGPTLAGRLELEVDQMISECASTLRPLVRARGRRTGRE